MAERVYNFDEEADEAPARQGAAPVPEDDYTVSIKSAELKDTKIGKVFGYKFTILGDGPLRGKTIERTIYLETAKGDADHQREYRLKKISELKEDLRRIGFDVANWTLKNKRPFQQQVDIASGLMIGCKLLVRVKDSSDPAYPQNVYINKRLQDDNPEKFGPEQMVGPDFGASPMDQPPEDVPPAAGPTAPTAGGAPNW